jgi:phosphoglycerate dehydrogenase-like enzyme
MKKTVNSLDVTDINDFNKIFEGISTIINTGPKKNLIIKEINNADAYLSSANIKVDEAFLKNAKKLKVIGTPSTGTDHLDLELIKKKNIICYDISKEFKLINTFTATSELAFSLMLSLNRKIIQSSQEAQRGIWSREKFQGFQMLGKTLGIIGLGRLGKISARIAKGFGMKVIAHDIKRIDQNGIEMVSLDKLANISDIVTIHVHLNSSTENLINFDFLKKMKPSSILINTSRGKIINELDLLAALKNKVISAAGLDVIDGEWLNNKTRALHPLINYANSNDNLLITPHIGGATKESIQNSRIFIAKKVVNYLLKI